MSAAGLGAAGLSVLLGAGVVGAAHLVTVLVARATRNTDGPVAAPVLAAAYLGKVLVLGWVLLTVPAPSWLVPGWLAAGVLGAVVLTLVSAARTGARGTRAALEPPAGRRRAEHKDPADGPGGPVEAAGEPAGRSPADDDRRDPRHGAG